MVNDGSIMLEWWLLVHEWLVSSFSLFGDTHYHCDIDRLTSPRAQNPSSVLRLFITRTITACLECEAEAEGFKPSSLVAMLLLGYLRACLVNSFANPIFWQKSTDHDGRTIRIIAS